MESESGVYHVLNRGNYRANIFRSAGAKEAFLDCVAGACERTGWLIHAWCIMSNHYHLAVSTPRANLVEGMKWLQGTFATRFNRFRGENGHLFQGRYKSLIVEPAEGLGPLCHYIHLNPIRARLCPIAALPQYRWTSVGWLMRPGGRPSWYDPSPSLRQAGGFPDNPVGRSGYLAYLRWLAEDEPAQKRQYFDRMSRGWVLGSEAFTTAVEQEHRAQTGRAPLLADELKAAREWEWTGCLERELERRGRSRADLDAAGKSAEWKLAIAAQLKSKTTVTNRWLSENLRLGAMHEVSRKVTEWARRNSRK